MNDDVALLFEPFDLGSLTLRNRVVMAPMTRQRSLMSGAPSELNVTYYRQRAGAGLIITEGTSPSANGQGYLFEPGLWRDEHVAGWRRVTDAVHAEGGRIFCQLMHVGRLTDELMLDGRRPVAPSAVQPDPAAPYPRCPRAQRPFGVPHALTVAEVHAVVDDYRRATERALEAGFDGVELHGANGYLPMQFLSTNTNLREDAYGGSVEKRAAFVLDCIDAMASVAGPSRVGIKIAPGSTSADVANVDPRATFTHLTLELSKRGLAYLHLQAGGSLTWDIYETLRPLFDGPLIAARGLTRDSAGAMLARGTAQLAAFGQLYIANPDLVERFRQDRPLAAPDVATYYSQGDEGYIDYPAA